MQDSDLYAKTEAGRNEIQLRSRHVATALRSMLLVVDGHRTAGELRALGAGLHAPADALEQLAALGLIERANAKTAASAPPPSDVAVRYITLSGLLAEAIREHMGLRGFFMQLKVERCSTLDDLETLLPEITTAVGKARGEKYAQLWEKSVRTAIAR